MYQALYRKYRPQTFDDVVGQLAVTQTLKNQILTGKTSHAYLFTGTRGTGKTTCAKILAKAVNCEHPVDGNPCNRCAACRSIDSGACMDVLEIDAASNNGVDNVRGLRDDAIYTPAEVRKRVYIIDEVHMLSMQAFNALLKIIEEPPEHLLFILATTELQKVPATILSRCQRFSFRRILPQDIADRLSYIAYQEKIDLLPEAAAYLARLADGSLRDAVSLLDQCASASTGELGTEQVCRTLGLAGTRQTEAMLQAIAKHDSAAVLKLFDGQYAEGKDLAAMLNELCSVARDLLILRTAPKGGAALVSGICTEQELSALLPLFSPSELLWMTEELRKTANGFNTSSNRRIDAELCLLRLCSPEDVATPAALAARVGRLEDRLAAGAVAAAKPAPEQKQTSQEAPPWDDDEPESAPWEELTPPPDPSDEPVLPRPQPPQAAAPDGFWPKLVEKARAALQPPAMGMFAVHANAPVQGALDGDVLTLECVEFAYPFINAPEVLQRVGECASGIAGRPIRVRAVKAGQTPKPSNGNYDKLVQRAQAHPDIFDVE